MIDHFKSSSSSLLAYDLQTASSNPHYPQDNSLMGLRLYKREFAILSFRKLGSVVVPCFWLINNFFPVAYNSVIINMALWPDLANSQQHL